MDEPKLEAVYYAGPIPASALALTHMALVFDCVHFPNVYFPIDGYEQEWVDTEIARLEALPERGLRTDRELIAMMRFLRHAKTLQGFCQFSGDSNFFGKKKDEVAEKLVQQIDAALFGEPKPGFIPIQFSAHCKGLGDTNRESIVYPGRLHYHAEAVIYAAQRGIPLLNDRPGLPIPEPRPDAFKYQTNVLSTIAAMQCVAMAIPQVRALHPEEIMEMRERFAPQFVPFRRAVLKLAGELNKAISDNAKFEDVEAAAKFLVETEVQPQLLELKDALEVPARGFLDRAFEAARQVPEIAATFMTMPPEYALAKALAAVGGVFVDEHAKNRAAAARSGFYYLMKIREINQ